MPTKRISKPCALAPFDLPSTMLYEYVHQREGVIHFLLAGDFQLRSLVIRHLCVLIRGSVNSARNVRVVLALSSLGKSRAY